MAKVSGPTPQEFWALADRENFVSKFDAAHWIKLSNSIGFQNFKLEFTKVSIILRFKNV